MAVDPVPLSREATIPLGLVMNELVANACEHAFSDGSGGTIRVSLRSKGKNVRLAVADKGVPLPPGFDLTQQTASMGMRNVHNMAKQLGGRVELTRDGAWKAIEVEFPSHVVDRNAILALTQSGSLRRSTDLSVPGYPRRVGDPGP